MKWHDEPETTNGIQVSTLRDEKNLLVILTKYPKRKIAGRKVNAWFEIVIGEHSTVTFRTCFDSMDRMKKIAEVLANWDL